MNTEDKAKSPVTGFLIVPKVSETVGFVTAVFGGAERERYQAPGGKTWYSVIDVAGTPMNLMEQFPSMGLYAPRYRPAAGGDTAMFSVSVSDVDATYKKALEHGATPILAPHDAYWGDRYAEFRDKSGTRFAACSEAALTAELTPEEQKKAFDEFQTKHDFPATPARIVGVNQKGIVNAMPAVHLAFAPNDTTLTPESKTELAFVADYMQENPDKTMVVIGHTDSVGAPHEELVKLSVKRAEVVAKELVEMHEIAPHRFQTQGVGALSPIATNATEEGRTLNRRVVFIEA